MINGEKILAWQAQPWEIEKHSVANAQNFQSFKEIQNLPDRFETFYSVLFQQNLRSFDVDIKLWRNSVSGSYKIELLKDYRSVMIQEEAYREDLLFLVALQGLDLATHFKTLINSLEFSNFLKHFISF